jgi:hypothetical protein
MGFYFNTQESIYVFNEIRRNCSSKGVLTLTDEEISKCRHLAQLIENKQIIEISEEDYVKIISGAERSQVIERVKPDKEKPQLAESLGQPQHQVCLDPRDVISRMNEPVEERNSFREAEKIEPQIDNTPKEIDSFSFGEVNKTAIKKEEPFNGLEIWWQGPASDAGGYGKMNRKCVEGLVDIGVKTHLEPFKVPDFRCLVKPSAQLNKALMTDVSDKAPSVWGNYASSVF